MSRAKCRHRDNGNREVMHWVGKQNHEINVCSLCNAWLSLGPSNDDSEAVKVEIRAAELAANWKPIGGVSLTDEESDGWTHGRMTTDENAAGALAWMILSGEDHDPERDDG